MNTLTYKDYTGSVNHSEKDNVFFGKIEGINALVNYEGDNIDELTNAFHEAVDDYLNYCKNATIRNVAMIGFFENYPIKRVFRINDSLLLTGKSDQLWAYISSESKDELKELLQKIGYRYEVFCMFGRLDDTSCYKRCGSRLDVVHNALYIA